MPYRQRINAMASVPASEIMQLQYEFDSLRAELNDMRTKNAALLVDIGDIRTKYTALVALLVAATAPGAGYSTGTGLNAATVSALAAAQFTPT